MVEGDTIVSALHSSPPQLQSDRAETNVRTREERRRSCNVTTTNHRDNNIALNHFSESLAMICVRGEGWHQLRRHHEDTPGECQGRQGCQVVTCQTVAYSTQDRAEDIKHRMFYNNTATAWLGWAGNINVNCKKHWRKIINNDAIFWEINLEHCHYSWQLTG